MDRLAKISSGDYALAIVAADADGAPVTATDPALTITDGAGQDVGTYTPVAAAGELTAAVPAADLAALDVYTCSWSGTVAGAALEWTSHVELAGGYLFEIAELRASDPAFTVSAYSGAKCRAARTAAEERLEAGAHVAFVPRAHRLSAIGDGSGRLRVPHNAIRRVVAGSIAGVDLTAAELAALVPREWGAIDRPDGYAWTADAAIELHYEHGLDFPPAPVREAAMILAREYLVRSALSARATVEATDVGFYRLSVAGKDKPTGIPDVDAVIETFGRRRPLVG